MRKKREIVYLIMWKALRNSILALSLLLVGFGSPQIVEAEEEMEPQEYNCKKIDFYNYASAVPYSEYIDDAHFYDSLFVGDSRMGSMAIYGKHKDADVAYVTSLSLIFIDERKVDDLSSESMRGKGTLTEIMYSTDKNNIYMLFGINEIRNKNFIVFGEKLQEIVTNLLERNPAQNIYIMLAYHPDYISGLPEPDLSEHLLDLNTTLIDIAYRNRIYYMNLDNGLDDENNTIRDELVWDGLHLNVDGAHAFEDYIATHVVRGQDYVKEICE